MERTLCDAQGCPVAYIAEDGQRTICLWNGHVVAYIDERLDCYGWNGNYLGWIENGVLFDAQGQSVGFMKFNPPTHSQVGPAHRSMIVKPIKQAKSPGGSRPERREGPSSQPLADFLRRGAVEAN